MGGKRRPHFGFVCTNVEYNGSIYTLRDEDGYEVQVHESNVILISEPVNESNQIKSYCGFCFNSRVYHPTEEELQDPFRSELTDENDFSSICVGHSCNGHNLYLSSGAGRPMRFEVFAYNEKIRENQLVGLYSPKFCPECGRALTEYE